MSFWEHVFTKNKFQVTTNFTPNQVVWKRKTITNQQTSLSSPIFFSRIYFAVGRGCCNTHWIDIALDFQDFSDLNICELSILFKFQLLIFREADDEIKKLSRLAEQLNPKLNDLETSQFGQNSSTDQVDLDQLFNFLSKEVADSSAPSSGSIRSEQNFKFSHLLARFLQYYPDELLNQRHRSPLLIRLKFIRYLKGIIYIQ